MYRHVIRVTIDRVWIGNQFIGLLHTHTTHNIVTINYNAVADSHTLQFTTARTKSSQFAVSSLGTARQQLLSFHVQQPLSLLALLHCRLHSTVHCLTSNSILEWLSCAQSCCLVTASNGGCSSSSRLTFLQTGDLLKPASYPHCRFICSWLHLQLNSAVLNSRLSMTQVKVTDLIENTISNSSSIVIRWSVA
jgi:hypothetical protein